MFQTKCVKLFLEMLSWFVDQHTIEKVLHENNPPLIEENEVETRPERVPMKCLDENVSLIGIKRYFSFDAWKAIENVVKLLNEKGIWSCFICKIALNSSNSVCCDDCLNWYHLKCVGFESNLPKKGVVLPRVPSFGKIKVFLFGVTVV